MTATPNLQLPEFGAVGVPDGADLTKAMRRLDAIVQLACIAFISSPPSDPVLGQRWIVEAPASDVFSGHEMHVACWTQYGWIFFVPSHGWQAVVGAKAFWVFDETAPAWTSVDIDFYSPATTKGDLLVHNGSGLIRLPVGANGTVITADSSQSGGLKYSAASGSGGAFQYVSEIVVSGAAATNIVVSSLDLDSDECYFLQVDLCGAAAGTATLNVFFNNDSTLTNYERSLNTTAADNSAFGGLNNGDPGQWNAYVRRCPVTGRVIWTAQGGRITGSTSLDYSSVVVWDTSANLTSLTINSSVASQIAIGSRVRVWKVST